MFRRSGLTGHLQGKALVFIFDKTAALDHTGLRGRLNNILQRQIKTMQLNRIDLNLQLRYFPAEHIHIGNAYFKDRQDPAWGDNHPRFGYPGSANDVPEIVAYLRELFAIGYLRADGSRRGAVSFEIKPVGDEDAAVMIASAKRKLTEAWARLVI